MSLIVVFFGFSTLSLVLFLVYLSLFGWGVVFSDFPEKYFTRKSASSNFDFSMMNQGSQMKF